MHKNVIPKVDFASVLLTAAMGIEQHVIYNNLDLVTHLELLQKGQATVLVLLKLVFAPSLICCILFLRKLRKDIN